MVLNCLCPSSAARNKAYEVFQITSVAFNAEYCLQEKLTSDSLGPQLFSDRNILCSCSIKEVTNSSHKDKTQAKWMDKTARAALNIHFYPK